MSVVPSKSVGVRPKFYHGAGLMILSLRLIERPPARGQIAPVSQRQVNGCFPPNPVIPNGSFQATAAPRAVRS